jgi:hypothetical protein
MKPVMQTTPNAASDALGSWLAAALDDPLVCAEFKRDIRAWFDAGSPPYNNDSFCSQNLVSQVCPWQGHSRKEAPTQTRTESGLRLFRSDQPHELDTLIPELCQLIDSCKQDWQTQGCWSEWDQSVRDRITAYNLRRKPPNVADKRHGTVLRDGSA